MWQPRDHCGFQFLANYNAYAQRMELFMKQGESGVGLHVPETITMVKHDDPGRMLKPMLVLGEFESQGLMDALWESGLRLSSRANESDLVQAKDSHIQDLRDQGCVLFDAGEFRASG